MNKANTSVKSLLTSELYFVRYGECLYFFGRRYLIPGTWQGLLIVSCTKVYKKCIQAIHQSIRPVIRHYTWYTTVDVLKWSHQREDTHGHDTCYILVAVGCCKKRLPKYQNNVLISFETLSKTLLFTEVIFALWFLRDGKRNLAGLCGTTIWKNVTIGLWRGKNGLQREYQSYPNLNNEHKKRPNCEFSVRHNPAKFRFPTFMNQSAKLRRCKVLAVAGTSSYRLVRERYTQGHQPMTNLPCDRLSIADQKARKLETACSRQLPVFEQQRKPKPRTPKGRKDTENLRSKRLQLATSYTRLPGIT